MVAGQVLRDGNVKESKTNHTGMKLKLIIQRKKKKKAEDPLEQEPLEVSETNSGISLN